MIYRPPYGSTCLNAGCVPSKFLIHRARIAHVARTAARFHVDADVSRVRLSDIVREMGAMIEEHRNAALDAAQNARNLTLIEVPGGARFLSRDVVMVGKRRLRAPRIFIATGLRPHLPDGLEIDSPRVLTSDTIMNLTTPPERLVVIGGGYIACELGQAYHRFGSNVSIVQSAERLLPHEEPDVSVLLERAFGAEGIEVLLRHHATRLEQTRDSIRVHVQRTDGTEQRIEATHVLIAAGRRPNTDSLQLESAGIVRGPRGDVRVNARLETNVRGIWAIGDVNGQQPYTRVCQEEARVAFANAIEGKRLTIQRHALPHAVFTDPEIGSVGYTESIARELGIDVVVGLVTFDRFFKAQLIGETNGLVKYVVERKTRRVVGCHVIGPIAADLIYDAVLVMRHSGTLDEIGTAVGVFPTLQEGMEGTARALLKKFAPGEMRGPLVRNTSIMAAVEAH
jgi:pyruvate/2-oxoglutarate dehydrogenase complex dihydrolipoamide dehydrogenase (E3) component